MDCLQIFYSCLLMILVLFTDVSTFTLDVNQSADKAILGNNSYTLSCTYSLITGEVLYSIELQRKRESDSDFVKILTFQGPTVGSVVTYQDTTLQSRTVATNPTEDSRTATLLFNQIVCDDKATYRWKALYYSAGENENEVKDLSVVVKANALFTESGTGRISQTPNTNIEEGDNVTFTCSGDVGNEPVGHLGWFYYLNNITTNVINASTLAKTAAPTYVASTCSYTRTSTLELMMTKEFHQIVVRCTVQQDRFDQFGDGHVQTKNIPVYYSPRVVSIKDETVEEGRELLTLTCTADAYPNPEYYWVLPNGTMSVGPSYTLSNIQLGDNGTYTCVVYNTFKGANHTVNETTYVDVRKTTTPAPTTSTTTPSPGLTDKVVTKSPPSTDGKDDNQTTIIIVVCVVVGLLIIVGIVVVVLCVKKRKKAKEIEEPPEKPRNNQDLSFYGNRPDLVSADHGMKNNMGNSALNSSFNNSFDSTMDLKQRNEDGLLYIDLQFDDKPRSRRPIQIIDDGGSTPYADIVNPRV